MLFRRQAVKSYGPGLPSIALQMARKDPAWRANWEQYKTTQGPIARQRLPWIVVLCMAVFAFSQFFALAYVSTRSVDAHVVLVLKGVPPHRGDLVAFAYAGQAIGGHEKGDLFLKYLTGLPGDAIERKDREFYLGNKYLGHAKEVSGVKNPSWLSTVLVDIGVATKPKSIPLEPSLGGVIPPGMYWVQGTDRDALDSRYAAMGLVPRSSFIGRAVKVF